MQEKRCPVYGGSILDNYVVKLYARAYRDLDEIYAYIAYTLLEPGTAVKLIDDLCIAKYKS